MLHKENVADIKTNVETRKNKPKYGRIHIDSLTKSDVAIMSVIKKEKDRTSQIKGQKSWVMETLQHNFKKMVE